MLKSSVKDNVKGTFHEARGKIKEMAGKITDNPTLEAKGKAERIAGKVQEKIGQAKKVLGHQESYITKGGCYDLDDFCDTHDTVAVGDGNQLHDGGIHPYTAGYSNRRGVAQSNTGAKTGVGNLPISVQMSTRQDGFVKRSGGKARKK